MHPDKSFDYLRILRSGVTDLTMGSSTYENFKDLLDMTSLSSMNTWTADDDGVDIGNKLVLRNRVAFWDAVEHTITSDVHL
jgi:hypothetical protein